MIIQACTDIALQVPKNLFFEFAGGAEDSAASGGSAMGGGFRQRIMNSLDHHEAGDGETAADAWGVNLDIKELNVILRL